jgi:cytochrome c oxidase subunit 2
MWRFALLAAGLVVVAGGCSLPSFGAPDPASEEGDRILELWQGFLLTALGVFALVWGLLIFVLLRYRRRSQTAGDPDAADDGDAIPSQRAYNIPVEIVYTAIPIVVVAVLFGFSVATETSVTSVSEEPAVVIDVIGFQWSWQFEYVDEGVTVTGEPDESPEMVLPLDQPVQLNLIANDVIHSFWVPDFLSKRDLIPGVDNTIEITPNRVGTFVGRCAEYCGLDHWQMDFSVRVAPEADYQAWLDERREAVA